MLEELLPTETLLEEDLEILKARSLLGTLIDTEDQSFHGEVERLDPELGDEDLIYEDGLEGGVKFADEGKLEQDCLSLQKSSSLHHHLDHINKALLVDGVVSSSNKLDDEN